MKKSTAISHFGSVTKTAKALGITQEAVTQWGEEIPERRAYEIERITNGSLKHEPSILKQAQPAA